MFLRQPVIVTRFERYLLYSTVLIFLVATSSIVIAQNTQRKSLEIFVNGGTTVGYNLGVNTSENLTNWVTPQADKSIRMAYPSGQSWGAVFITYGQPDTKTPINLSQYSNLSITAKGATGGESVWIGIKDTSQLDGQETKIPIEGLTTQWKTYEFRLTQFTPANISKIYVVCEFVFSGSNPQTVFFNNVTYLTDPLPTYNITVTQTANGLISPDSITVINGSTPTFSITPNPGYHIATINVNGAAINVNSPSGQSYQFPPITSPCNITATFASDPTQTPTVTPTPTNPTGTPNTSITPSPAPTSQTPTSNPTANPSSTSSITPTPIIPEFLNIVAIITAIIVVSTIATVLKKRISAEKSKTKKFEA
jgi:hypothetical protein